MVVCKFFLQGTCKFGHSCRFEHQINDSSQGSSILRQPNQNPAPGAAMDPTTLVRFVINDMTSAEQGKQWIFSSYSPFKDKPPFPGFEDRSFEEIRLGFYEATQNGTVEQYKQMVQMWYQDILGKMKVLQNPSEEIIKILTQIYNTPVANQGGFASPTIFGGGVQNSNLIFGGNNPQGDSIFRGAQNNNNNSAFGQKSIFGGNINNNAPFLNNQTIFGNANNTNTNNTIFGPNNSNMVNTSNNFMQNTNTNPTNSIFGQTTNTANNSIFGQNTFGVNPQNSVFVNSSIFNNKQNQQTPFVVQSNPQPTSPFVNPTTQASPFGNQPTQANSFSIPVSQSSPFGNAATQSTPFANANNQSNTHSIFGSAPTQNSQVAAMQLQTNTSSIFGGQTPASNTNQPINIPGNIQSNTVSQPTQSIFGQSPTIGNSVLNKNVSIFGTQVARQNEVGEESWYSKLEDLSEEDIKSFESEQFEFGKIPENPPTLQMCF